MIFRYQDVAIEWQEGKGYLNPQTGQWVETSREVLKGWIEPDPARRKRWLELIEGIEDFWRRQDYFDINAMGDEISFA